jgi:hypothetical protein
MNQKGFVNIVMLTIAIIAIAGLGGYFILNREVPLPEPIPNSVEDSNLTQTSKQTNQPKDQFNKAEIQAQEKQNQQELVKKTPEIVSKYYWLEIIFDSDTENEIRISDAGGKVTGNTSGGERRQIPLSQFLSFQNQKTIIAFYGATYKLNIKSMKGGIGNLILKVSTEGNVTEKFHFSKFELNTSGEASMTFTKLDNSSILYIDGDGDGNPDKEMIPVTPPIANIAFVKGSVYAGEKVVFDGSASTDQQGKPLTYKWTMASKGPEVVLSGSNSAKLSFVAPNVSKDTGISFRLVVNNGDIDSEPKYSNIIVKMRE